MTNIGFELSNDGQYVQFDKKKKKKDYEQYEILNVVRYTKEWTEKQSQWTGTVTGKTLELSKNETYPLWLGIRLKKIDSSLEGFAPYRYYYLYISQGQEVKVDTYAKPRLNSGNVKANTWSDTIWRKNSHRNIEKYNDLLRFYLLFCPAKPDRAPSKQFIDVYSIWGKNCFSKNKEQLKAKLSEYKVKGLNDNAGGIASTAKDMQHRIESFDLLELQENTLAPLNKENRVVLVDTENNQYLSLFKHLRNSVAHGSFLIYSHLSIDYYIFQDSYKKHVTARGIIDIHTLEEWKKIILSKS
ncbi:MAG: hypothetical protein ACOYH0_08610 [Saccharofermentanales bacterium]